MCNDNALTAWPPLPKSIFLIKAGHVDWYWCMEVVNSDHAVSDRNQRNNLKELKIVTVLKPVHNTLV